MSPLWQTLLAGKARMREELAALPFVEKIKIAERLRDRSLIFKRLREEREARVLQKFNEKSK